MLFRSMQTDIVDLFLKTIDKTLDKKDLIWRNESCLTIVLTSKGYPGRYNKGIEIKGIDNLDESIILFHNGTKYNNEKLVTNGGRVLSVTSLGKNIDEARNNIYNNVDMISFEGMNYRKDIGLDI